MLVDYTKSYKEATLFFFHKLFYYLLTVSGTLAVILDILCQMKNFKFLRIFGSLQEIKGLLQGIKIMVREGWLQEIIEWDSNILIQMVK